MKFCVLQSFLAVTREQDLSRAAEFFAPFPAHTAFSSLFTGRKSFEAGHGFESYTASRRLPLMDQTHSTSEINEIHSMAMEHFTYPWMEKFFWDKTPKYLYDHL